MRRRRRINMWMRNRQRRKRSWIDYCHPSLLPFFPLYPSPPPSSLRGGAGHPLQPFHHAQIPPQCYPPILSASVLIPRRFCHWPPTSISRRIQKYTSAVITIRRTADRGPMKSCLNHQHPQQLCEHSVFGCNVVTSQKHQTYNQSCFI